MPTQLKVFFNLDLFGRLRRGELIALTWDDLDLDNKTISVTKSTGYTGKETITKVPKNRNSIRDLMFPGPVTDLVIADSAGQQPDIPLHGFRHISATLLISENVTSGPCRPGLAMLKPAP
ncbi:MAG TPA: hypothetical protein DEG06_02450 [Lachnospiraceae bacterium]|nr:hypothetical protein [Lachnospiraceae bacterium]HBI74650.1 hypothetical protein [Lachnospiraceae bacterium]HBY71079.1 hypothetical protein [Lachnospiraceae bacterium]HCA69680.1 hypothetical protein [Lachnospiraceae bacterium]HCM12579.1 hypothetical protein [Lachnospiraceae bacterium]